MRRLAGHPSGPSARVRGLTQDSCHTAELNAHQPVGMGPGTFQVIARHAWPLLISLNQTNASIVPAGNVGAVVTTLGKVTWRQRSQGPEHQGPVDFSPPRCSMWHPGAAGAVLHSPGSAGESRHRHGEVRVKGHGNSANLRNIATDNSQFYARVIRLRCSKLNRCFPNTNW